MHYHIRKKRLTDQQRFARWHGLDADVFQQIGIGREKLQALQLKLRGRVVLPGDPEYDKDRKLFNPVFNPFPLAIVYCVVEDDVRWCMELATIEKIPFVLRSGGHTTAGYSSMTGRMVVDVSGLNDVTVDPTARTATVGCGTPFSKLNAVLANYGLHVPGGECEDVCIGGYMQGGGYGFTSRTFGMNCDHVQEVRVMLFSGRVVNASAAENSDLWWAVRGGTGNNFGVLLSVIYTLVPLDTVWGWSLAWAMSTPAQRQNAAQALLTLQQGYMKTGAPDQLNTQIAITYQQTPIGSTDLQPWLSVRGMYVGSAQEGQAAIKPLTQLPGAVKQYTISGTYEQINAYLLDNPQSLVPFPPDVQGMPPEDKQARYVSKDLSLTQWRSLLDFFVTSPNPYSYMCLEVYGGAINRYPKENSAFVHRDSAFSAFLDVFWLTEAERKPAEKFLADWCSWWMPVWNGGIYQNYPSPDVPNYRDNYWREAFPTLLAVKKKYDPLGVFTFPQAITPAPQGNLPEAHWPPPVVKALAQDIVYPAYSAAAKPKS